MGLKEFRVYQLSLEFAAHAGKLARTCAVRRPPLADQLDRSADSVVLNVAEGTGERAGAEQRRFYRMALRSATECEAALDLLRIHGLADPAAIDQADALLHQVMAILRKLAFG